MTTKFSILFNGTGAAGSIPFGFSETWYSAASGDTAVQRFIDNCKAERLLLLPNTVRIVGYRAGTVALPGAPARAFTYRDLANSQGAVNDVANVPNDSALCQVQGTTTSAIKRFWIHCLPDSYVEDSAFVAAKNVPQKVRNFLNGMRAQGFLFRYIKQDAATQPCNSIDATGLVALNGPLAGAVPGATVQLLRVRNTNGQGIRGFFRIASAGYVDTANFKLLKWLGSTVAVSGQVRIQAFDYQGFLEIPNAGLKSDPTIRPGVRKPGRPFNLLRGRAAVHR